MSKLFFSRHDMNQLRQRKRTKNLKNDGNPVVSAIYVEESSRPYTLPKLIICIILTSAIIICGAILLGRFGCERIKEAKKCPKQLTLIHPILDIGELQVSMKENHEIFDKTHKNLLENKFFHTKKLKLLLNNKNNYSIKVSTLVYSNIFSKRIGEISIPLSILYHEFSIDEITIIEDTTIEESQILWEKDLLFGKFSPNLIKQDYENNPSLYERFNKWAQQDGFFFLSLFFVLFFFLFIQKQNKKKTNKKR